MASTRTTRGLRLNAIELKAFLEANRKASAKRRADYLTAHPDYIECLVAGCDGLVVTAFRPNRPGRPAVRPLPTARPPRPGRRRGVRPLDAQASRLGSLGLPGRL